MKGNWKLESSDGVAAPSRALSDGAAAPSRAPSSVSFIHFVQLIIINTGNFIIVQSSSMKFSARFDANQYFYFELTIWL